jgi:hypothetical protein
MPNAERKRILFMIPSCWSNGLEMIEALDQRRAQSDEGRFPVVTAIHATQRTNLT